MSLKRKRVLPVPPGMKPPGIKKSRMSFRRKRQNKLRNLLAMPQTKYHDVTVAATEINYDGAVEQLLNGIAVGDSDTTRDGQSIVLNSIQVKGIIREGSGAALADVACRYMIVLDRNPNETTATLSNVIVGSGGAGADVYALRRRSGSAQDRFKVLVDRQVVIGDHGSNATGTPSTHMFAEYIKLSELCVFNDDGTGNSDDFQKGALYLFAISEIQASAAGPTIEFKSRCTFFDK